MSPDEIGAIVVAAIEGATAEVSFDQATVDVPAASWLDAATFVRDDERLDCRFFDWLSAYDDQNAGLAVVVHLWSTRLRHHVLLRTRVARDGGRVASLTALWPGASWHERETYEMFGV